MTQNLNQTKSPQTKAESRSAETRSTKGQGSTVEEAASKAAEAREETKAAIDAAQTRVAEAAGDAREAVEEGYREAADWARGTYEEAAETVDRGYREVRAGARQAADEVGRRASTARSDIGRFVDEHPLMVGVLGFAGGLVLGALLPRATSRLRDSGGDGRGRDRGDRTGRWYSDEDGYRIAEPARGGDADYRSSGYGGHGGGAGRVNP